MNYAEHPDFIDYQRRINPPETGTSATSVLLAVAAGAYVLLKTLDFLGFPVWLWKHQLVHMSMDALGLWGPSVESDSDSNDDTTQRNGGLLGSMFGLNPANLLQKGVRGVAGALSVSPSDVPPGLGNISNSCYQNSVIQGLASLPSLREYLSLTTTEHSSLTAETTNGALYDMLCKLNDPNNHGQHFWIRGKLKSMSTFQQQDAQEYFSKVLDALDEEIKKAASSKRRSSVSWLEATRDLSDLPEANGEQEEAGESGPEKARAAAEQPKTVPNPLDGLLAQRVGCISCGYSEGLSLIPFNCITVSLGKNYGYDIRECLDEYTILEHIDGVECAKCTLLKLKNTLTPLAANKPGSPFESRLKVVQETLDEEDFEDKTLIKKLNVPKKNWVQSTKSKQAVVARAPKALVLHVNRSSFDEMTGNSYKNNAGVAYPRILDLGNWCLGSYPSRSQHPDISMEEWPRDPKKSMLPDAQSEPLITSPFQYKLRAAVTHYGSHGSGHYVCYRPHPKISQPKQTNEDTNSTETNENTNSLKTNDANSPMTNKATDSLKNSTGALKEQWWRFSDDSVFAVAQENAHQGNVFMLFYERVDEPVVLCETDEGVEGILALVPEALLPPTDVDLDRRDFANDAARIPLPIDSEDDLEESESPPAASSLLPTFRPETPLKAIRTPLTDSTDFSPARANIADFITNETETEMSEAESEDTLSTQLTSDYESEADVPMAPTAKLAPVRHVHVPAKLMRTAGNASARGQGKGNRQALPLVSAT